MKAYNSLVPEIIFSVTQHCATRSVAQLKAFNPDQVIIAGVCIIREGQVTSPASQILLYFVWLSPLLVLDFPQIK